VRSISTDTWTPGSTDAAQTEWVYNGLDTMVTREVFDAIAPQLSPVAHTYAFSRAMQGPALEMMLRGIRIDMALRREWINTYEARAADLRSYINELGVAVWGRPLIANKMAAPQTLAEFFYGALGIPPIKSFAKGVAKISTNREAMEKIQAYFHARPIALAILALRDTVKMLGTLHSGVEGPEHLDGIPECQDR